VEDVGVMRSIPNMTVLSPSDGPSTRLAVKAAIEHQGPVYLRLGRLAVPVIYNDAMLKDFSLGKGILLRDGKDLTIAATGLMVHEAIKAADMLAAEGVSARVLDFHTLKPIDRDLIIQAARETGRIVTAEEHNMYGGLGSAVAEILAENYPVPVRMVAIRDQFGKSGKPDRLIERYKLTAQSIVDNARMLLAAGRD